MAGHDGITNGPDLHIKLKQPNLSIVFTYNTVHIITSFNLETTTTVSKPV
jgi:hypothetical protein